MTANIGKQMPKKLTKKENRPSLEQMMRELKRKPRTFHPSVYVQANVGLIEICLENVACYHRWIEHERADVSLWLAHDDDRVVGATLPLKEWHGFLGLVVESENGDFNRPVKRPRRKGRPILK